MRILTLGLNHHTAPVEIRERLAFPEDDQPSALARLIRDYGLSEAAILSTCNRSELYLAADGDGGLDHGPSGHPLDTDLQCPEWRVSELCSRNFYQVLAGGQQ